MSKKQTDSKKLTDKVVSAFEVDESSMRANSVDHVSSLLTSLLVLVALAVVMLGILFFMRMSSAPIETIALPPEMISGRGDNAPGLERDFDPPAADEVEQLNEPAVESTLQMVSEAITNISDVMESLEAANRGGSGKGDSRQAGPEGEGDDIIPRFERWDLKFQARDRKGYAVQLDYFKIELGAYGGTTPTVDYVSNLASAPAKRTGTPKEEKRLYFLSVSEGVLKQYDKLILQGAGINLGSRPPIKFVPAETEEILAQAEARYYRDKVGPDIRVANIAKTVFECRPSTTGKGFEFFVVDQRYRNAIKK